MADENDKRFDEPQRVAINCVYTRKGDGGRTALVGGQKVRKHATRIHAYGTVDELNAFVGAARQTIAEGEPSEGTRWLDGVLHRVQHELFNLGSLLATLPEDVYEKQPVVGPDDIARLEAEIDRCNATLPTLRSFVLPGGSRLACDLHVCRTVCRRAERICDDLAAQEGDVGDSLAYLNRLSDAFFVWGRWVIQQAGCSEIVWDPNVA